MNWKTLTALAALGSAGLLAGAFIFQLFGYAPCQMCIWQRYPHAVAAALGGLALLLGAKWILPAGAAAAATTSAIGFFHAGVEQGWWEGPTTCSGSDIGALSADALLDQILTAPLVRCDEIPWEMFGLSMAAWNGVISLALVGIWVMAWRQA
jgi:disulfide bond formation protein DsbB